MSLSRSTKPDQRRANSAKATMDIIAAGSSDPNQMGIGHSVTTP